jgi:putative transcriptional regulator
MTRAFRTIQVFGTFLLLIACAQWLAHAADLSRPVILAATDRLESSGYQETVLVAAPLPQGGHIGFIINRPTNVKMETAFPGHAPARHVTAPIYFGGPVLSNAVFAVTRIAPEGDESVLSLMPGLVAVFDAAGVDRIIETNPNDARYFAGLVVWAPDQLDAEIDAGAWDVLPADVNVVFRANATGLWKELTGNNPKSKPGNWV